MFSFLLNYNIKLYSYSSFCLISRNTCSSLCVCSFVPFLMMLDFFPWRLKTTTSSSFKYYLSAYSFLQAFRSAADFHVQRSLEFRVVCSVQVFYNISLFSRGSNKIFIRLVVQEIRRLLVRAKYLEDVNLPFWFSIDYFSSICKSSFWTILIFVAIWVSRSSVIFANVSLNFVSYLHFKELSETNQWWDYIVHIYD